MPPFYVNIEKKNHFPIFLPRLHRLSKIISPLKLSIMILAVIFLIPFSQASGNCECYLISILTKAIRISVSLSSSPKCTVLSDCPKNFAACMNVTGLSEKRCVKDSEFKELERQRPAPPWLKKPKRCRGQ